MLPDGELNGYPDADIIETAIKNGDIIVRDTNVSEDISRMEKVVNCKLGFGERERP
ncbi:MAG: hypothetical protein P1P80_08950 [ANME-2 cluster archaeon]|nr:hypothetical protein [ANME-2 cluster archaeon]